MRTPHCTALGPDGTLRLRIVPDESAGLDVLEVEVSEINPFADLQQVVVTPHTDGITRTSTPCALRLAAENIDRFLRGEPVVNLVS